MIATPFPRLLAFIQKYRWLITGLVILLQISVAIIDLAVFAGRGKSPWTPFLELAAPWLLLALLRPIFHAKGIRTTLESPYMALAGGFLIILSAMLVGFLLAFQILNWFYDGQMHGGLFYYPSIVLVFLWAIPEKTEGITDIIRHGDGCSKLRSSEIGVFKHGGSRHLGVRKGFKSEESTERRLGKVRVSE